MIRCDVYVAGRIVSTPGEMLHDSSSYVLSSNSADASFVFLPFEVDKISSGQILGVNIIGKILPPKFKSLYSS